MLVCVKQKSLYTCLSCQLRKKINLLLIKMLIFGDLKENFANLRRNPCTVKSKIGFFKTYSKIWIIHTIFNIFQMFFTNFHFQGSHIWAIWLIQNYMATLKMKSDSVFVLRKLEYPQIWILIFRFPKFCQSGLPYLRRLTRYDLNFQPKL